jgi:hypothetical protein
VTLSLMLGEPFCYFADIICCICIFRIFLQSLNPAVFLSAHVYSFLKKLYCLWSGALLKLCTFFIACVFICNKSARSRIAESWGGYVLYSFEAPTADLFVEVN